VPPDLATAETSPGATWVELAEQWDLIEADFHEVYGIDLSDGCLDARTGRWLITRIQQLATTDCRLSRHFTQTGG
jgi:hypothetical protein